MLEVDTSAFGVSWPWQSDKGAKALTSSIQRMSTLKRLNQGADDPASQIAAENLQAALTSSQAALDQFDHSRTALHIADGALTTANEMLGRIRANVVAAASDTLSDDARAALQLEVDAALDALDHLRSNTSYGDLPLLQGGELSALIGAEPSQTASVVLPDLNTAELGDSTGTLNDLRSGGSANLTNGDLTSAMSILNGARSQILAAEIEAATFERYSLDVAEEILQDTEIQASEALSQILDTDVAAESATFVQAQIRAKATILAAKAGQDTQRHATKILDYLA